MPATNLPVAAEPLSPLTPTIHTAPLPGYPSVVEQLPSAAAGLALRDIVVMLRRRLRVVLGVSFVVTAAAALLALSEDPIFTATAVLRIGDARRLITTGIELPDVSVDRLASPLLSQIQLLRSRTLAGAVVDSVGLRLVPAFDGFRPSFLRDVHVDRGAASDTVELWFDSTRVAARFGGRTAAARYGEPIRLPGLSFVVSERPEASTGLWTVVPRELAIDAFLGNLRVKPRTQTNVVDVAYSARRPSVAQRVVNTVASLYQFTDARSAQEQSRRRRLFLESQIAQTDSALTRAQLALSEFRRQVRVYSATTKLQGEQGDLARLDSRAEDLDAQRQMYLSLLGALDSKQSVRRQQGLRTLLASPVLRNNPAVTQLHDRLQQLQAASDSLTTGAWRRSETDPDVALLRGLIVRTETELANAVRGELAWVDATSRTLSASRTRNIRSLDTLTELEGQEMRLNQQVDALHKSGDMLREDYQKARMAEEVEVGPVEIVDLAALPYEPDAMMRVLKLLLGMVLGLGMGGAAAVALDLKDTSIRGSEDLERVLQVPALGTIPRHTPETRPLAGAPHGVTRRPWPFRRTVKTTERSRRLRPAALVMLTRASRPVTEAYRVLRTNLLFSRAGQMPRTLAVTSAAPSDGKSVTAANLAITCAQSGMRVLLVDCDLRRGQLHHLFGIARSPGIAQLLQGSATAEEAIRASHVVGLDLLTAGEDAIGATETLRSTRMLSLLRALPEKFDLVILDSPPVLAVADASMLGAVADGVLLVLRVGHTDRADALAAVQQLDTVGARVLGAVLNDAPPQRGYSYVYDASGAAAVAT